VREVIGEEEDNISWLISWDVSIVSAFCVCSEKDSNCDGDKRDEESKVLC
jgi:hypothetical protein